MIPPEILRFAQIFQPYALDEISRLMKDKTRLVHYTSAEAAMNIILSGEVWMRKSFVMNDFSEVQHGLDCIRAAFKGEHGEKFKSIFNRLFGDNFFSEFSTVFDSWVPLFLRDTYLISVSEHSNEEDTLGRLSMWRAYGEGSGVALVLNNLLFITPSDVLKAYSSPVAYLDEQSFALQFARVVNNMETNAEFLKSRGSDESKAYIFQMLRYAAVSTKHPGFSEEKEWRVIYLPSVEKSPHLTRAVRSIKGMPQVIYRLPLKDIPSENLVGLAISSLIDRIIIGPTQHPYATQEAFISLLADAKVENPERKVFVSNIPLRR
jgi:hypothetical protein